MILLPKVLLICTIVVYCAGELDYRGRNVDDYAIKKIKNKIYTSEETNDVYNNDHEAANLGVYPVDLVNNLLRTQRKHPRPNPYNNRMQQIQLRAKTVKPAKNNIQDDGWFSDIFNKLKNKYPSCLQDGITFLDSSITKIPLIGGLLRNFLRLISLPILWFGSLFVKMFN